jgi:hypothetical protein
VNSHALLAALAAVLCACSPQANPSQAEPSHPDPLADVERAETAACGYPACSGPFYSADGLEFGEPLIGTPMPAMPSGVEEPYGDCVTPPGDTSEVFCTYRRNGVLVLGATGRVRSKSIFPDRAPTEGLPFGLQIADTPEQVRARLEALSGVPFWIDTRPSDGSVVRNRGTLRNQRDEPVWLYVMFDDNDRIMLLQAYDPRGTDGV